MRRNRAIFSLQRLGFHFCFFSSFRICFGAPRPLAFRLRGQDPLWILALGDLQWVWGLSCLSLPPSSCFWSLVPWFWKGIPPTPLLLIARPSRLLRGSGGWLVGRRGGGRNLFPAFGGSTRTPFSRRGLASCICVVCRLCFVC